MVPYALVEPWLAELCGFENIPFPTGEGELSLIGERDANRISRSLNGRIARTSYDGLYIIIHPYYMNFDFVESMSTGEDKQTGWYQGAMNTCNELTDKDQKAKERLVRAGLTVASDGRPAFWGDGAQDDDDDEDRDEDDDDDEDYDEDEDEDQDRRTLEVIPTAVPSAPPAPAPAPRKFSDDVLTVENHPALANVEEKDLAVLVDVVNGLNESNFEIALFENMVIYNDTEYRDPVMYEALKGTDSKVVVITKCSTAELARVDSSKSLLLCIGNTNTATNLVEVVDPRGIAVRYASYPVKRNYLNGFNYSVVSEGRYFTAIVISGGDDMFGFLKCCVSGYSIEEEASSTKVQDRFDYMAGIQCVTVDGVEIAGYCTPAHSSVLSKIAISKGFSKVVINKDPAVASGSIARGAYSIKFGTMNSTKDIMVINFPTHNSYHNITHGGREVYGVGLADSERTCPDEIRYNGLKIFSVANMSKGVRYSIEANPYDVLSVDTAYAIMSECLESGNFEVFNAEAEFNKFCSANGFAKAEISKDVYLISRDSGYLNFARALAIKFGKTVITGKHERTSKLQESLASSVIIVNQPSGNNISQGAQNTIVYGSSVRYYSFRNASTGYKEYDLVFRDTVTNSVYAVMKGNTITMLVDPFQDSMAGLVVDAMSSRINGNMTYEELVAYDSEKYKEIDKATTGTYSKLFIEDVMKGIKAKEQMLDQDEQRYGELMEEIQRLSTKIYRTQSELRYVDKDKMEADRFESAKAEIENIKALEKVSQVIVDDRNKLVSVFTHNMYVKNYQNNKWYDIGTFKIDIRVDNGEYHTTNTVRAYNTKFLVDAFEGSMNAPHAFRDGHFCHGNLVTGITKSYKERDMFGVVYQILIFLSSVNLDDAAGRKLASWPEVTEEVAMSGNLTDKAIYGVKKDTAEDAEFLQSIGLKHVK